MEKINSGLRAVIRWYPLFKSLIIIYIRNFTNEKEFSKNISYVLMLVASQLTFTRHDSTCIGICLTKNVTYLVLKQVPFIFKKVRKINYNFKLKKWTWRWQVIRTKRSFQNKTIKSIVGLMTISRVKIMGARDQFSGTKVWRLILNHKTILKKYSGDVPLISTGTTLQWSFCEAHAELVGGITKFL